MLLRSKHNYTSMAEKILYYLGAGASAKALPLARSIWDDEDLGVTPASPKLRGLAFDLKDYHGDVRLLSIPAHDTGYSELEDFIADLGKRCNDLAEQAEKFGDVDTYAKYLHLINPAGSEFKLLKQTLSQYFAIKQTVLDARDPRYLPWLVGIMNRRTFPENVKVLSWNYDFQVELAALHFDSQGGEDVEHKPSGFTHSPSLFSYYPNLDPTFNDFEHLSLIHLNGIAGFGTVNGQQAGSVFQQRNSRAKGTTLSFVSKRELHNHLHFAWESSGYHGQLMDNVNRLVNGTTIMVVIGYSFPFFNRDVDKKVFEQLIQAGTLKKIYYQDPSLDGKQLREQFAFGDKVVIKHIRQVDNFHIPFEY
jgi:hypothetical protein